MMTAVSRCSPLELDLILGDKQGSSKVDPVDAVLRFMATSDIGKEAKCYNFQSADTKYQLQLQPSEEVRRARDGLCYRRREFLEWYGLADNHGPRKWEAADMVSNASDSKFNHAKQEVRKARDGLCYTEKEFLEWYGLIDNLGPRKWAAASRVPSTRSQMSINDQEISVRHQ